MNRSGCLIGNQLFAEGKTGITVRDEAQLSVALGILLAVTLLRAQIEKHPQQPASPH